MRESISRNRFGLTFLCVNLLIVVHIFHGVHFPSNPLLETFQNLYPIPANPFSLSLLFSSSPLLLFPLLQLLKGGERERRRGEEEKRREREKGFVGERIESLGVSSGGSNEEIERRDRMVLPKDVTG